MAFTGSGVPVENRSSPRAPVSVSATSPLAYLDSGALLLAAAGEKRFKVKTSKLVQPRGAQVNGVLGSAPGLATGPAVATPVPEIATRVTITNRSGQPAEITLIVAKNEDGSLAETPDAPIYLANGDRFELDLRVVEVIEKNVGNAIQVTPGVCYIFHLESRTSA